MFCRKKLSATEAKIIAHIGLQKKRAADEKRILETILHNAKGGYFHHTFRKDFCEPHKAMLSSLNYVIEEIVFEDWDYSFATPRTKKYEGLKVSWE